MRPASRHSTLNFAMNDMSMRMTPSRVALCSSFQNGNQCWRPHERRSCSSSTWGPAELVDRFDVVARQLDRRERMQARQARHEELAARPRR